MSDKNLIRKLAIVLILKLVVLLALWWGFVREQRVPTSGESVAAQFLASSSIAKQGSKQ